MASHGLLRVALRALVCVFSTARSSGPSALDLILADGAARQGYGIMRSEMNLACVYDVRRDGLCIWHPEPCENGTCKVTVHGEATLLCLAYFLWKLTKIFNLAGKLNVAGRHRRIDRI